MGMRIKVADRKSLHMCNSSILSLLMVPWLTFTMIRLYPYAHIIPITKTAASLISAAARPLKSVASAAVIGKI